MRSASFVERAMGGCSESQCQAVSFAQHEVRQRCMARDYKNQLRHAFLSRRTPPPVRATGGGEKAAVPCSVIEGLMPFRRLTWDRAPSAQVVCELAMMQRLTGAEIFPSLETVVALPATAPLGVAEGDWRTLCGAELARDKAIPDRLLAMASPVPFTRAFTTVGGPRRCRRGGKCAGWDHRASRRLRKEVVALAHLACPTGQELARG